MKKNNFKSLAAVLSLAMAATAIPVNANAAAAPKLTVKDTTVFSGRTYSMTVKNLKKGYTVQFSSTQGGVKFNSKKVKATGTKVSGKFTVNAAKNIANNSKTKIKAVVKNASGKKVKSLTKQVTLKQLAKSFTVKDIAQTTVKVGAEVNADATIAPSAAKGAYKKVFTSSDSSVLQVTNPSNGLFKAVAPGTATIEVTASNGSETISGSKSITITVEAADDTTPNTPVTPGTPDNNTPATTTTGPAILTDYQLTLTPRDGKTQITANGIDQTIIDITLAPPTDLENLEGMGNMKVAVDLVLGTANVGSLSQNRLTLNYNSTTKKWEGYIVFTSATLNSRTISNITANVASVIDDPAGALDGKQLNGLASNPVEITLVPAPAEEVQTGVVAEATKAVVESCDRMIITFNRNVTPEDFLKTGTQTPDPEKFALYVQPDASDNDNGEKIDVTNKAVDYIYNYTDDVAGILPVTGHADQLEFVFNAGAELKDNSRFFARFVTIKDKASTPSRILSDRIVDTSVPTVMDVTAADSMNSIIVKFDQPVVHYLKSASGYFDTAVNNVNNYNVADPNPGVSALAHLNFSLDGYNLAENETEEFYKIEDDKQKSLFGKGVKIEPAHGLYRDTIKITLGTSTRTGNQNHKCYLTDGEHVLQISNVGDYASLSDTKNNKIDTQTFKFKVSPITSAPDWELEPLQSVEQFIVRFTTPLEELEGIHEGEVVPYSKVPIRLQYQKANGDWAVDGNWDNNVKLDLDEFKGIDSNGNKIDSDSEKQSIRVIRIDDTEDGLPRLKVEVTRDWTNLWGYVDKYETYISRNYRLFIPENKIRNLYNGKTNGNLSKRLSNLAEYDGKSPTITAINEVHTDESDKDRVYLFDVVFDEPVQAGNDVFLTKGSQERSLITPGFNRVTKQQEVLGTMSVEIVNKATKKAYSTKVLGYSPDDLEDKTIRIQVVGAQDSETFPAGDYIAYARYVSDDAGNTVSTKDQPFQYGGPAATGFKVLSVLADKGNKGVDFRNDKDEIVNNGSLEGLNENNASEAYDYIYVEFSADRSADVLIQNNWTLNGMPIPSGSHIEAGIKGSNIPDSRAITIVLPSDYLTDINRTNLRISANVTGVSSDNKTLALEGQYTFNTPAIFIGSAFYDKAGLYVTGRDNSGNTTKYQMNTKTEISNVR